MLTPPFTRGPRAEQPLAPSQHPSAQGGFRPPWVFGPVGPPYLTWQVPNPKLWGLVGYIFGDGPQFAA